MVEQIMADMVKNGECLRMEEAFAVIRPKAIMDKVKDKLLADDINDTETQILDRIRVNELTMKMCSGCEGTGCPAKNATRGRVKPSGSVNAFSMLIDVMPSMYSAAAGVSFSDEKGFLISIILNKMKIRMESVYMTSMIKCCNQKIDEDTINKCAACYIMQELMTVRPKLIICDGLQALRGLRETGCLYGLPDSLSYGTVYDVSLPSNHTLKAVGIYDLAKVLAKSGDDLTRCKGELWKQIYGAYNSAGYFKTTEA